MMNNKHTTDTYGRSSKCLPWILAVMLGLLAAPVTYAQEDAEGEIFELSPFTIEPEEGWIATETLAGSRLRTDFKDVAAQVEIFTMEFMEDYGINSMEESLIYSLNVANAEDRVTTPGGFGRSPNNFQQIRGVGAGTRSRNFFRTDTPSENYNISRLTIASGPQSILFGTGSPAGVLDVTLRRAETSENFGQVSFQTDSNGGHRVALDYNLVIFEDKLAIRIDLVDRNTEQDWDPNWDKMKGYYAALTWKPFENTTIMAHYERQERDWNRTIRFLPFDNSSAWFSWGQPSFDNSTAVWNDLPLIYNRGQNNPTVLINDDGTVDDPTTLYRNTAEIDRIVNMPGVSPVNFEADNWTLIDNSVFPVAIERNLTGNSTNNVQDSDIYNLFIEQKIMDNWFLELAYNKETQEFDT